MVIDFSTVDAKQLATLVCETLAKNGVEAILVGGACVTIYSENHYQSHDLDFATYHDLNKVGSVLKKLGFERKGKYFVKTDCPFYIDLVNPPIAVGEESVKKFERLQSALGTLVLLTPVDCVKDRLAAFFHWNDLQALEQALLVSTHCSVDLDEIKEWSTKEGHLVKYKEFLNRFSSIQ